MSEETLVFASMNKQSYEKLKQIHPCLGADPENTGRIHLPVSPVCNLACRYCRRSLTDPADRPGTTFRILPVEEVPEILKKALTLCPEITTVGIAGPGDTLASDHAIEAFRLTDRFYPHMVKCLSTNGLMLNERAEELAQVHVDAVTVTVNAVDPAVQAKINDRVWYRGTQIRGEEAADLLIRSQLDGIHRASGMGIAIKVNIVLIPGINDQCVEETARKTAEAGARICNIIPLIPQAGMAEIAAPGCAELETARKETARYLDVFRHCRHCRADAAGRLGKEDFGKILYGDRDFSQESFSHG